MRVFAFLLGGLLMLAAFGCSIGTTDFNELDEEQQQEAIDTFREGWVEGYALLGFTEAEADCTWDVVEEETLANIDKVMADANGFAIQFGAEIGEKYSDEILACLGL